MCKAIAIGHCSLDLSRRDPGSLANSRWLTAANRILRLYVGTEKPSANLRILVEYIVKVYAPMWFRIKASPSCKDGAKHLWQTIQSSRYLSNDLKRVISTLFYKEMAISATQRMFSCACSQMSGSKSGNWDCDES